MKRYLFNIKTQTYELKDWIPNIKSDFGPSCVKKQKYVNDKVRINNQEVSTGTNRTALYTMPGGVDNGVRYAALYDHSGLDITEIEANKRILQSAKTDVENMLKNEVEKTMEKVAETSKSASKSADTGSSE